VSLAKNPKDYWKKEKEASTKERAAPFPMGEILRNRDEWSMGRTPEEVPPTSAKMHWAGGPQLMRTHCSSNLAMALPHSPPPPTCPLCYTTLHRSSPWSTREFPILTWSKLTFSAFYAVYYRAIVWVQAMNNTQLDFSVKINKCKIHMNV
jgi:hypothetical protein